MTRSSSIFKIEEISNSNYREIAGLAFKLWPDSTLKEELDYFQKIIHDNNQTAFLLTTDKQATGFVLVSLRYDYVEGATSKPICYVEGIYIEPLERKRGLARLLVEKAESWGKLKNCKEIASDTEIGNFASIDFHKSIGFKEVNRVVCFIKNISLD